MRSKLNGPSAPRSSWRTRAFRQINDSRAGREMASSTPLSAVRTCVNTNMKPISTYSVYSLTNGACITDSFALPFRKAPTTDSLSTSTTIRARRKVSGCRVQTEARPVTKRSHLFAIDMPP